MQARNGGNRLTRQGNGALLYLEEVFQGIGPHVLSDHVADLRAAMERKHTLGVHTVPYTDILISASRRNRDAHMLK